jgi:glycosyltransferase involved in cell wall biosynthesis
MKIAFILRVIYASGVTTSLIEVIQYLVSKNIKVTLIYCGIEKNASIYFEKLSSMGVRMIYLNGPTSKSRLRYLFEYFLFTVQIKKVVDLLKVDLVHLHSPVIGLALRLRRINFVQTIHQSQMHVKFFRARPIFEICVSTEVLKESQRINPYTKSIVIHNSIDINRFKIKNDWVIQQFKDKYSLGSFDFIISTVANIEYRKGHDIIVNAINLFLSKYNGLKINLLLAGRILDGQYYHSVIRKAEFSITHLNFVSPEVVYWNSDLHILASRKEAFGNVVIESMVSGVVSVRSDTEGASDQIINGESGFLFDSENVEELALLIEHIYLNRNKLSTLKVNAQNFVEENFSNLMIGEKHLKLYKYLLINE